MQAPVAVGIYIGDTHVVEFANPMMCAIWDRTIEQVINRPLFEALPEVAGQGFEEILAEVLRTGQDFTGNELPATLKRNGKIELTYFNILYKPLLDSNNTIKGIIQVATEVTEQVEARKKAERNEEVLKVALAGGKMGTWYMDFVQHTITRSLEHDQLFGYPEMQPGWNYERLLSHVHPEDREIQEQNFRSGLENGQVDYKLRIIRTDHVVHWVQIKGKTAYNLKGQPVSMSGVIMDVTEQQMMAERERQQAAELAAREEAERQTQMLYDLFMNAPAVICSLQGPDLRFEFVNPLYQQLFPGRPLLGRPILEALPELRGQPVFDTLQNVFQTGNSFTGNEVPVNLSRSGDGPLETRYFNFHYQARRDKSGTIEGVLVFAFEVTDQLLARQRVESSEENLRIALEAGKMGTWHLNLRDNTSVRTPQHDQIFGYQQLLDSWGYTQLMNHVLPQHREYVANRFTLARETGNLSFEAAILTADQRYRWIAVKGKAFFENGKVVEMAGVVTDITERKKSEDRLKELTAKLAASNKELKEANKEIQSGMQELSHTNNRLTMINEDLDNFIYTASHDLRAPIANIEGLMRLLVRHLPAHELEGKVVKETIQLISASVERFKHTIRELTDIAKLQKEVEESSFISMADLFDEVRLDMQTLIQESAVDIDLQVADCPPIFFSYKNLKSIIYNLLSNAIKYQSPERSPRIRISCGVRDGHQVIAVEDNGLGMKAEDTDKIFQMFKRLHTHVEGSGVGLYLVKRIVDNSGGRLEVESEEGKGSTFRVFLPVVAKE